MTNRYKTRAPSHRLGGQRAPSEKTSYVLAVSVLASLWPEEFPGGWVGMSEVIAYSRDGSSELDANTRMTFYRARLQLEERMPGLTFEPRTFGRHAQLRVDGAPPHAVVEWLLDVGADYITGYHWDRFVAARVAPPRTPDEADDRMVATTARILVVQGRTEEALELLRAALKRPVSLRQKMAITIAWAFAAGRSGDIREFKRAQAALEELARRDPPAGDMNDRLLKARVRVELAYGKYLAGVMGRTRDGDAPKRIAECERLLTDARRLHAGFSPADQARLENVSALLTKARGLLADAPDREALLVDAKSGFLRAFSLAESVDDAYAMGAALYNIGELCYARDRLERDDASEEDASEALSWFSQSVAMAERLGVTRDLYLDHARLGDVLTTVASARLRRGLSEGVAALLLEAERLVEIVRTKGNRLERKLGRRTALRLRRAAQLLARLPLAPTESTKKKGAASR